MGKKCEMVRQTPELRTVIGLEGTINLPKDGVMIDRPNYKAVACDLEDMPGLDKVLTQTLDAKGDPVLFLAEVSITYMDALAAEKLVEWASTFNDGRSVSRLSRGPILTRLSMFRSIRTIFARWRESSIRCHHAQAFPEVEQPIEDSHTPPFCRRTEATLHTRFMERGQLS